MSSLSALPQEIVNYVIDHVVDGSKTSIPTLKACSTVSPAFRDRAQRNLFVNTHITISGTSLYSRYINFQLFLTSRPQLCLHIEHLFLHIKSELWHSKLGARFSILPSLPRLVALYIRSELGLKQSVKWPFLPPPLQQDLERIAQLPTLHTLEIWDMWDVPSAFLLRSPHLTKLVVHESYFTDLDSESTDLAVGMPLIQSHPPSPQIRYLKTFSLHTTSQNPSLLHALQDALSSSLSIDRLTEFSMSVDDLQAASCAYIISTAYPSIESLHLIIKKYPEHQYAYQLGLRTGFHTNSNGDYRALTLGALANLKRLHLAATSWRAFSEVLRLIASLPAEAPLKEITLAVQPKHPQAVKNVADAFRPLDGLLLHADQLRCLRIIVDPSAGFNMALDKELPERLGMTLPRWNDKGCLVVEVR